jgi:hypothetical protein
MNARIVDAKRRLGGQASDKASTSGPELYGFGLPKIASLIEGLPRAVDCFRYVFRGPDRAAGKSGSALGAAAVSSQLFGVGEKRKRPDDAGDADGISVPPSGGRSAPPPAKRARTEVATKTTPEAGVPFEVRLRRAVRRALADLGTEVISLKEVRRRAEEFMAAGDLTQHREAIKDLVTRLMAEDGDGDTDDDEDGAGGPDEDDEVAGQAEPTAHPLCVVAARRRP